MFMHKFKTPNFCKREFPDCGINYRTICDCCFWINKLEEENNHLQKKITEPQQPKNVTVFVTREELNRHGYDWLYCDKPHDPIQVQGILCA